MGGARQTKSNTDPESTPETANKSVTPLTRSGSGQGSRKYMSAGAVEVVFHGAHRDDQPLGDLTVGQPTGGEGDDFVFAVGERQWCGEGGQRRRAGAFTGLRELVSAGGGVSGAAPLLAGVNGGDLGGGIRGQQ